MAESAVGAVVSRRGNLLTTPSNIFHVGHIQLSISDIEFVADEIVLDDADVVLVEEHVQPRARVDAGHRGSVHSLRPFDDAVTRIWSRAANMHAFR